MGKSKVYDESGGEVKMKKSFKIAKKLEPFYTGGMVVLSTDQKHMFCQCENQVKIVELATGQAVNCFGEDEDAIITICGNDDILFTAHRASFLIKQWKWNSSPDEALVRSFKAHPVPVTSMAMDSSSTLLGSGATDSVIRVWDIENNYCTHQFKGSRGVVTLLIFHPSKLQLFSSADDLLVKVWDLQSSSLLYDFKGHVSPVTALLFLDDATCVTAGRDKVLNSWDLSCGKLKETFPVFEVIEGMVLCEDLVVTAGEKGILRSWDLSKKLCVNQQDPPGLKREFVNLIACNSGVLGVTFDQNILIYDEKLKLQKNLVGYNDEIIDIKPAFDGHIVLATNSEQIRIVNIDTLATNVLSGHTGTVLSIDTNTEHGLLVTSSKDSTVRIWKHEGESYVHVFTCTGHTSAVSGVAWSHLPENIFLVSVSSDLTLKLWQPAKANVAKVHKSKCIYTVKAHDKDINCVSVSPNDKYVVTGSLDKTAKVWSADKGELLGVLKGHKRGIWSARFSPVDQCILTSSGDAVLKLWRLSDYSCIRTYEGHSASVLNCQFTSLGRQIVSCCADGLINVWDTQSTECVTTLDTHTDKCWALMMGGDGGIVSGAADSLLCFWKDVTAEEEEEEIKEEELQSEQQQELRNLVFQQKFAAAFALSLALNMPYKCLAVAEKILELIDGTAQLRNLIENLAIDQIETLLEYLATWNTNSKHTITSQNVLFSLLSSSQYHSFSSNPKLRVYWEALIPYTERHFERLTKLQQQATFLQYTWDRMKLSEV